MTISATRYELEEEEAEARRRYAAAVRHSGRVRLLRRTIPIGAVLLVGGILFWAFYEPFKVLPEGVSVGSVTLNGSKVTMDMPKLSGFKKDNRPYEVTARWAEQDMKNPSIIDLREVKAEVVLQDKTKATVDALNGTYNSQSEMMVLRDDVRVRTQTGYDVRMKSAEIEFKQGNVRTDDPVTVKFTGGTINAEKLEMFDNGQKIVFSGRVKTIMNMAMNAPGPKASAAGDVH